MALSAGDYLGRIRTDADRLLDAAATAGLGAAVPSCPDWTVAGLLRHIGRVHRWVAAIVTEERTEPFRAADASTPPDDEADYPAWAAGAADSMLDALGACAPATEVWNWAEGVAPAAFWLRRMAHETAMHRVDAELAAARPPELDSDLAADAIDELAMVLLPVLGPRVAAGWGGETIHLHRTDGDGEWLVRVGDGAITTTREHGKGDAAVRGGAAPLLLWAQNRAGSDGLEVFGDAALLDRWRETLRF